MGSRRATVMAVLACALAVAEGCGSSSPRTTGPPVSPAGATGGQPNGEASKPPDQIVDDAARALRTSGGFAVAAKLLSAGQQVGLSYATRSADAADLATSVGGPGSA
jgi:hypothetical protein